MGARKSFFGDLHGQGMNRTFFTERKYVIQNGFVGLERSLRKATARRTQDIRLRANPVYPWQVGTRAPDYSTPHQFVAQRAMPTKEG